MSCIKVTYRLNGQLVSGYYPDTDSAYKSILLAKQQGKIAINVKVIKR